MYCPRCRSEYVPGYTECRECGVDLVDELPAAPLPDAPGEPLELESVLATGRGDVLALAQSILMSADVDFTVRGELVQDLFGYGRFPGTANRVTGGASLLVRPEDAADARELLAGLDAEPAPEPAAAAEGDAEEAPGAMVRYARPAARIATFGMIAFIVVSAIAALLSSFSE